MKADLVIRNGVVVDGTGAEQARADVVVSGDRVVAIEPNWTGDATRSIDAEGKLVTPGFVDIHTHLDAQLAWDPIGTSSCWHGITSVALGNCGVTFAPVANDRGAREFLAEMMESVEDIPRAAILEGLPWDWTGYDGYLSWLDHLPKGPNVGGLVGHCAVRTAVMGERGIDQAPATAHDLAAMTQLVDEAMAAGALGFSTSRTFLHKIPDGRCVPGTYAADDEMLAFADVLGKHGHGIFEGAYRLGERDRDLSKTAHEVWLMGEMSRRSGGLPVSFALTQVDHRNDIYSAVIAMTKEQNALGANLRPQTTSRGIGILFGLHNRSPFDRFPTWQELRALSLPERLAFIRNPEKRAALIGDVVNGDSPFDATKAWVLLPGEARYDCRVEDSLASHAARRGVSVVEAFLQIADETNGIAIINTPFLNQSMTAVEEMLDDPVVTLGLADAGAHVGMIMDSSQPTYFLTNWIRDRKRWSIEEGIRRLTSDTANLFGFTDRGTLKVGGFADINVFALDDLRLPTPTYTHDFPNGAGRYVQGSAGYAHTFVNGQSFMENGQHTGALAGSLVRGS
jgi:N-acyl-D-amino-acid deacylase